MGVKLVGAGVKLVGMAVGWPAAGDSEAAGVVVGVGENTRVMAASVGGISVSGGIVCEAVGASGWKGVGVAVASAGASTYVDCPEKSARLFEIG
jgi:hypothetical protein